MDSFQSVDAACCFLRLPCGRDGRLEIAVEGGYGFAACAAGGWLLLPQEDSRAAYWIPRPPFYRALDRDGHVLSEEAARLVDLDVKPGGFRVAVESRAERCLDAVIWQLPRGAGCLPNELKSLSTIESQPVFLWSSHTRYQQPADLYRHLIHGHVYENQTSWPHRWKVCSELDAYGLYVALNGLELATRKSLYALLKRQVLYSVVARQAADGGWYHGEWTAAMESHHRLHNGAMHLLTQALEENKTVLVRETLEKAAAFISRGRGHIDSGVWFLHDSLEQNEEGMSRLPFNWVRSRAFGKSPTNLLVLNTHLDATIALQRYQSAAGDRQYALQVESAVASAQRVLSSEPANWLYRRLYWAIGLTLLPTGKAKQLMLPVRAIKRITWKYLIPFLPRLKARLPRLVMPNGFIERDLSLCGWPDHYQSVTLMDLLRYLRFFPDEHLRAVIDRSLQFVLESGIRERWMELPDRTHALGFWAEALYRLCMLDDRTLYRGWLAEAMLDCADHNIGLSPSLLGGNAEAVPPPDQVPCPSPRDPRILIANLSRPQSVEFLLVNSSPAPLPLEWEIEPVQQVDWLDAQSAVSTAPPVIPARGWLVARSKDSA